MSMYWLSRHGIKANLKSLAVAVWNVRVALNALDQLHHGGELAC